MKVGMRADVEFGMNDSTLCVTFFALGERKKRNTKEDEVPLRMSTFGPPHKSCQRARLNWR